MGRGPYQLNWLTDSLTVGQAPMSYEHLEYLRQQGINAILNLCAEFCDLHWIEADQGFEVYYFPIPDEAAPDLDELEKALDWLDECLYLGKRVLVHCRHGIGRTGTVVNAYLLRKGLGHKLAGKKMKGLKSKPANFNQWWFIRRYGKKEKRLTIREPSLETKHLVDLFPFFADYERLVGTVNESLGRSGNPAFCGQGHSECCRELVVTTFIEAVYLNHTMNANLGRVARQGAIQRAVAATRAVREIEQRQGLDCLGLGFADLYKQSQILCPLNEFGDCLIFDYRPLACRLFDLPPAERQDLFREVQGGLAKISDDLFFAFTSSFPGEKPLSFILGEVVSGKFVQSFFHCLIRNQ